MLAHTQPPFTHSHTEHARSLGKACPLPPGVEAFMVPEEFPTKVSLRLYRRCSVLVVVAVLG